MGLELLQHIVVTILALGATTVIVRRVAGVVRTSDAQPKCDSCPSAGAHGQPQQQYPLTVVRSSDRH